MRIAFQPARARPLLLALLVSCLFWSVAGRAEGDALTSPPRREIAADGAWTTVETIVVQVDDKIMTWAEFDVYGRLWGRLPTRWRPVPPSSPEELAESAVERLMLVAEAEDLGIDDLSAGDLDRRVMALQQALPSASFAEVRSSVGLSDAEWRALLRIEELVDRVISQKFPYLLNQAQQTGNEEQLQRAIRDWLVYSRSRRDVRVSLPESDASESEVDAQSDA